MESAIGFACLFTAAAMCGAYTHWLSGINLRERGIFALVFFAIAGGSLLVDAGYPLFYGLFGALFCGGVFESIGLIKIER